MSKIVYVLGAGVNQSIKDSQGNSPPLNSGFFQVAHKKGWFAREEEKDFPEWMKVLTPISDFVRYYWKISEDGLANQPFDFEELFTFIELQLIDADKDKNQKKKEALLWIRSKLRMFVFLLLTDMGYSAHGSFDKKTNRYDDSFLKFGRVLWEQKPIVVTFNYDTFVESTISLASGHNQKALDMRKNKKQRRGEPIDPKEYQSFNNWNRALGYGIKSFGILETEFPGVPSYVDGEVFYETRELEELTVLKMHGSINWFEYTGERYFPIFPNESPPQLSESESKKVILKNEYFHIMSEPEFDGWRIDPIIIPPTLYKEQYFQQERFEKLFNQIWQKAEMELSNCEELVIIGYSFPPTDFRIKKLFLEAFQNHKLEKLTIVNPNSGVVQRAKDLCHFEEPITWCNNLEEYLISFRRLEEQRRKEEAMRAFKAWKETQSKSPTESTK